MFCIPIPHLFEFKDIFERGAYPLHGFVPQQPSLLIAILSMCIPPTPVKKAFSSIPELSLNRSCTEALQNATLLFDICRRT